MNSRSIPAFVDQPADLNALVERLASEPTLAIDTEFHAERRYRPDLMLVQLAAPDGPVFTVDPLAVDLAPLHPVLHDKVWIAHGAQRDVELLHAATGARPATLLDTQLMAGFAGLHFPARLDALARDVIGQQIDKGSTLSDWTRRPLSEQQLAYARGDVRLLCPLSDALLGRIRHLDSQIPRRNGADWVIHAGSELVDDTLAISDPHEQWRTLEIAPQLDGPTRAALHALYTWRETEARRKNSPPHYILAPSIALDLARRRPKDLASLRENRRIPSGLVKRHGSTILQILLAASRTEPPPPPTPIVSGSGVRSLVDAWMRCTADDLAIAPKLLAPTRLSKKIEAAGPEALTGWRAAALHDDVARLLRGEISLSVGANGIVATANPPGAAVRTPENEGNP